MNSFAVSSHQTQPVSLGQFLRQPSVMLICFAHLVLLCAALLGLVAWKSLLLLLMGFHLLLTLHAIWPRSKGMGVNHTRLPATASAQRWIALTFDDGPHLEVTPKVLEMLDAAQCKASFFCVAQKLVEPQHAALAREILARGHSLENHSYSHPVTFSFKGLRGLQREIDQATHTIHSLTGHMPRFFRAPAGIRNPLLAPLLALKQLQLASWTRRGFDTRTNDPARIVHRLTTGLAAGDILLIHDGNSAKTAAGTPVALDVLPQVLAAMKAKNLVSVSLPQAFQLL